MSERRGEVAGRPSVNDYPCSACGAPIGTDCTVRLSGVDTAGWSHDARIMAPVYADLAAHTTPPAQPDGEASA